LQRDEPFCAHLNTSLTLSKTTTTTTTTTTTNISTDCALLLPWIYATPPFFFSRVQVLAPTRELAQQIHAECVKFGPAAGLPGPSGGAVVLYGGVPLGGQVKELAAKPTVRRRARDLECSPGQP
jgi:hypothetical protein